MVSPTIFWLLSLAASFLFLIYGVLRNDIVILIGQTISFYIYIRNLQLKGFWKQIPLFWRVIISPLPVVLLSWIVIASPEAFNTILNKNDFTDYVIIIGTIGQLLLNLRYLYQWYFSEKAHESILPMGFWIISAVASVQVVYYAVFRADPVLLVAQSMGFVAYARNIYLSYKRTKLAS